jgi:hypothetical protein
MVVAGPGCLGPGHSVEQVEVVAAGFHGVDDEFVAAAGGVESEAQLPGGAVAVEVGDVDGLLGGVEGVLGVDAVLAGGIVDLHAT